MPSDLAETPLSALSPIQRPRTTAEEVEDRLILAIARGDKQPGERLTEAEVSAALEVSRVPAREAMQKLLLRGILVEQGLRGLRVADFSEARITELLELRSSIEALFFRRVLHPDFDRGPLIAALTRILDRMATLSGVGDAVELSSVDLEFHRTIAAHSGHELGLQIWEGLAKHMLIVFCRDWQQAADRTGEVELHRQLLEFVRNGDVGNVEGVLRDHFVEPVSRMALKS